jgi:hypothetical protein
MPRLWAHVLVSRGGRRKEGEGRREGGGRRRARQQEEKPYDEKRQDMEGRIGKEGSRKA